MMLSKPLIFAIDLAALGLILAGASAEPMSMELVFSGLVLFGIGVYATLRRYRAG